MACQCAELKGEESQPPEDDTPLNKAAEIEEITADDYFIKNAEVQPPHLSLCLIVHYILCACVALI